MVFSIDSECMCVYVYVALVDRLTQAHTLHGARTRAVDAEMAFFLLCLMTIMK